MCIYIYIYMCVYIHIYDYTHIFIYTDINVYYFPCYTHDMRILILYLKAPKGNGIGATGSENQTRFLEPGAKGS